jgi:hypothetical protein
MIERTTTSEQIETGIKKVRGKAQHSIDLIEAMYAAAQKAEPITGRGIGYKLFTAGMIPSMSRNEMQRVYRLLKEAREEGKIPWPWIVDETREIERVATWDDPAELGVIVAIFGTSSHIGYRSGARRAPCVACSPRCSINTLSDSFRCMGFAAPLQPMTFPRMTMVVL